MLFWRRGSGHFCRRSLPRHIASLKGGSTPTKSQVAENPPKMREGMRGGGFEPPRLAAIGPQPIVSASFTIPASGPSSNQGPSIGGKPRFSPYRSTRTQRRLAHGSLGACLPGPLSFNHTKQ